VTLNTKAAASVAAEFALSLEGVPARKKTTPNRDGRRNMVRTFQMWAAASEHAEHEKMCAHKTENVI
jgi:aminopeptidase Y